MYIIKHSKYLRLKLRFLSFKASSIAYQKVTIDTK